jgi:glycosyltransferase involved in cell wall biosynthesis
MNTHRPRVLIFVVAYEAESTLQRVVDRIPRPIFERFDAEVLVIDDSSSDRTFEVGVRSAGASSHPITVFYNRTNQGYGGNQKLGYQHALRNGFEFVVLLHGDGQYAPESIPDLLQPLVDGEADAVFGSRILTRGAARQGGMPLYKFVGNKILTRLQNALLQSNLSEFHSGFRAYRVSALGRLPFQFNTYNFHFDTEIIIQLMLAGCRIVEVSIPTYYGDEICRVNGMLYAKNVMSATLISRLHRLNIRYDRKFDIEWSGNAHYALKLGYDSSHTAALGAVPSGARVMDIGCGPGGFDRLLVDKGCIVTGADQFPPADRSIFKDFVVWNEQVPLEIRSGDYDYVLLLDIIEHLKQPEAFLDHLRRSLGSLDDRPKIIVTTGNVVFLIVRLQALLGNFNYGKQGILDLTHTRLYTFGTLRKLFEQCGFVVEEVRGIPAPFPAALGLNAFSRLLVRVNGFLIRLSRGLFSYQIFMRIAPTPTVDALLEDSMAGSITRANEARRAQQEEQRRRPAVQSAFETPVQTRTP